ncbi:MAG: Crp/Fnr family transcriptional regulator [Fusobacterium sp. JB021]|nr:Crp/Fnr family transcriptional regulator [Fusobacterium sp. JB021]MDP0507420.1 Crp/Fnr family transcriptional regulator [Fusobacterium sp. JB019]
MNIDDYIYNNHLSHIITPKIKSKIFIKNYSPNEIILNSHNKVNNIYFIVKGKVEISYITSSGKHLFLNSLEKGDFFGDVEYVNKCNTIYDVSAIGDTTIILLPFNIIDIFLNDNVYFWKLLCIETNKKILDTNHIVIANKSLNLKSLLVNYIIQNNFKIYFDSLKELSIKLNSSYRNLTRVIKYLLKENIIIKTKHSIIVIDKEKFLDLAEEL